MAKDGGPGLFTRLMAGRGALRPATSERAQNLRRIASIIDGALEDKKKYSIPTAWEARAVKAWDFYVKHSVVGAVVDVYKAFAIGDETSITCEDEEVQAEAQAFWERIEGDDVLDDAITQLLVKGDAVLFKEWRVAGKENQDGDPITKVHVVNPLSLKVERDRRTGAVTKVMQQVQYGTDVMQVGGGGALDPAQMLFQRWNAPQYAEHGNSMVLRAFRPLFRLEAWEEAERALATRFGTPLKLIQVGGLYGDQLIDPEDAAIEAVVEGLDAADLRKGMVVPWWVNAKIVGAEGHALDTVPAIKDARDDAAIAMGMPEVVLRGTGPNFATARVAFQRFKITTQRVRRRALQVVRWIMEDWRAQMGVMEPLSYNFPLMEVAQEDWEHRVLLEFYDRGLVSAKTLQARTGLPTERMDRIDPRTGAAFVAKALTTTEVLQAVATGVISPEQGAALLGMGKGGPDLDPGQAGAGMALRQRLEALAREQGKLTCGGATRCVHHVTAENFCKVHEEPRAVGDKACGHYLNARVVYPAEFDGAEDDVE